MIFLNISTSIKEEFRVWSGPQQSYSEGARLVEGKSSNRNTSSSTWHLEKRALWGLLGRAGRCHPSCWLHQADLLPGVPCLFILGSFSVRCATKISLEMQHWLTVSRFNAGSNPGLFSQRHLESPLAILFLTLGCLDNIQIISFRVEFNFCILHERAYAVGVYTLKQSRIRHCIFFLTDYIKSHFLLTFGRLHIN